MIATKYLAIGLALSVVGAGIFAGLWRYEVLDHKTTKASLETANQTIATHQTNIEIAERTNHEYQADIDRLAADVKRLRARPAKCVPVTRPPVVHPEQGSGREHASQNGAGGGGIGSVWLYDYAAECETFRIERNNCKNFVNQIWESR